MNHIIELIPVLSKLDPQNTLLLFTLIFTRWLVMTCMIPFFGALLLPALLRVALASMLSVMSLFLVIEQSEILVQTEALTLTLLFLKEGLIGFILGFLASLIFYTYELFGLFIDFARAASMSKILVPELKHQSSPMGTFLFQLSLVIFFSLGLHRVVIKSLALSFEKFPPLSLDLGFFDQNAFMLMVSSMSSLFSMAFSFALPVIFVCFLIDLAFGLMNRVAPQINAYFLSLPAKLIGGLLILFFLLPFLLDDFVEHFSKLNIFLKFFIDKK